MYPRGPSIALTYLLAAMLLPVSGCKDCEGSDPLQTEGPNSRRAEGDAGQNGHGLAYTQDSGNHDSEARGTQPEEEEEEALAFDNHLISLAGEIDITNRYRAAVIVTAEFSQGEKKRCSGVVAGPRVVLTAGHCACRPRERPSTTDATTTITAASCAENAIVRTVIYDPTQVDADTVASASTSYKGTVRPHPDLSVSLDKQGHVVASKADLAAILLKRPIDKEIPPVALANTEVQAGDPVTVVGHGYDELTNTYGQDRRFSKTQVARFLLPGSTTVLTERPSGPLYRQDSGGPCLHETGKTMTLVGISSRNLGEGATFTSIHNYRDWIQSEIQHTSKKD